MGQGTYQRARSDEHKLQRAAAFLDAARTVALRDGVHGTTLVAIAQAAGLHHSAVRRYFPSRDAVLLRRGVDGEELLSFKHEAMAALGRIVAAISTAAPDLGSEGARSLMTAANSLAANLWQVCHPPPALAAIYKREPQLGHVATDFAPILQRLLTATACGLAQRRRAAESATPPDD
jgi:AcrR family transcriptional regulator